MNEVAPKVGAIVVPAPAGVVTAPQWGAAAARSAGAGASALASKAQKGYEAAKNTLLNKPEKLGQAGEVLSGVIDPGPPSTPAGYVGASARFIHDKAREKLGR